MFCGINLWAIFQEVQEDFKLQPHLPWGNELNLVLCNLLYLSHDIRILAAFCHYYSSLVFHIGNFEVGVITRGQSTKWHIQSHAQKTQFVLLAPDRCFTRLKIIIFKIIIEISSFGNCCEVALTQVNATEPRWWGVKIVLVNCLVPSGHKPWPEPMLTNIFDGICHHQTAMNFDTHWFR